MRSKLITAIVAVLLATTGMSASTATAAPPPASPIVSQLTLPDGSGGWRLHQDGNVDAWGKVPDWGDYPALPAKSRQGQRTFVKITTTGDGKLGYALISNHGERYVFRPGTQPATSGATTPTTQPKTATPAKPVDPPTSVSIASSANPSLPGDPVTFTVTVASTAIPQTTGQLKVTDNGAFLPGCNPIPNPTYEPNGSFVGTCTTIYPDASSHLISAIFTGDEVFAQSAGSMTQVVKAAAPSGGGGGGGSPTPTTVPSVPAVITLGVTVPTAVQSASPNYLHVTYTSTASTLSDGVLAATATGTVTFVADGVTACTQAVSSSATSASCAVTWGAFGSHTINVTYTDTAQHTSTTGTQTVSVTPPPLTVNASWGVTAPTATPTVAAYLIGTSAAVTVTAPNWEGVTAAVLTDDLGDTCTLAVAGTVGSCTMTVTGTPSTFTLAYPGGTPVVTTQAVNPNGVQTVNTLWGARSVAFTSPTVTIQAASPQWTNATIGGVPGLHWQPSAGFGTGTTPSPITTGNGSQLRLTIATTGNAAAVPFPHGTLEFAVSGGTYNAFNFGAFGSGDCSAIANFSGQANGGCAIVFTSAGTYTIDAWYRSDDPSVYADVQLSTITVTVV